MAQKQAAIKVGQAYIPVEVDFAGLGARMRKEINDELKKVGRSFELPADGLKIPVSVESKGGQKVIDQIVPSEKEVKSRLSRISGAFKAFSSKTKSFAEATKYAADGLSAKEFKYDASGLDKTIQKTRGLLNLVEKYGDKIADLRKKPISTPFKDGFGGAVEQGARKSLPIASKAVLAAAAKEAADAFENQLEGGLLSATGRIADKVGQGIDISGPLRKQVGRVAEEAKRAAEQVTGESIKAEAAANKKKAAAAKAAAQERIKALRAAEKTAADLISGKLKRPAGQSLQGGGFIPDVKVDKHLQGYKAIFDEIQKIHAFSKKVPGSDDAFKMRLLEGSEAAKKYAREYQGLLRATSGKGPWTEAAAEAKEYLHTVERIGRNTNLTTKSLTHLAVDSRKAWQTAVTPLEKLKSLAPKVAKTPLGLPAGVKKQTAEIASVGKVARQKATILKRTGDGAIEMGGAVKKVKEVQKGIVDSWGKIKLPKGPESEAKKFFKNLGRYSSTYLRSKGIQAISKYGKLTDGSYSLRARSTGKAGKVAGFDTTYELQKEETRLVKFAQRGKKVLGGVGKAFGLGFRGAKGAVSAALNVTGLAARLTAKLGAAGLSAGRAIASGIRSGLSAVAGAIGGVTSAITAKLKSGLAAGFRSIGKAGGAAMKAGLTAVKAKASDFIQGGVASFKHLGVRAGQAIGLALAGASGFAAKTGVSTAAHFETAEVGMTTMLGSAEKAKNMLNDLAKFSARTPFELRGIVDSSKQLLAYGFRAEQIMPILQDVGDAAGALGLGNEGVDRITRALGQFKVKGRVMAEEMLQLTETGIPAYEILAEHYGKTVREVTEMVHKGEVDAESGIEALRKGMHKRYQGLMDRQAETLSGIMSNIKDQFALTTKDLFLPMVPQVKDVMRKVLSTLVKTAEFAQKDWPAIWERLSKDPLGYLNDMVPAIKAKLGAVDWNGLWGKTVSGFKYVWDGLGAIASQIDWKWIGKSLLDAAIKGLSLAYDMAKKLGNMFIDWFVSVNWGEVGQQVLEGLGKALAWMNTERGNLFGDVGTRIINAIAGTDWAAEGFKLGEALRNGLMAIWDSTVDLGERLRNWVASVDWGQVWSNVTSFTSAFVSGLFGGSGDAGQDIAAWFNSIDWAGIQAQAVGWYEGFASMLASAWESTKATVGDWTARFVEWFQSVDWPAVGQSIREGLVAAWEQLLDWLANIGVWLWENLWPAIDKFIQFLIDPKLWAGIVDVLAWALNAIWDLIVATAFKLVEWFKAIDWVAVGAWFGDTLWKILESLVTIIVKAVIELGKLLGRILYDGFNFLLEAVPTLWNAMYDFAETWTSKIVQYMKDKFWEGIEFIGNAFLDMFPGAKDLIGTIGGVIGFSPESRPPKPPAEEPERKRKGKTHYFEEPIDREFPDPDIVVNQHFNGAWIEPEQAKRAAKLGARAGV